MKRIIAVIREEKLEDVKKALIAVGCDGMNISEIRGRGRQMGIKESYRGSKYCMDLIPKSRVELIVKDEDVEEVANVVIEAARTGDVGDGKLFISSIDEVIRIRTGERGDDAV
jgi:nitrogen regulatory protein P-II 1